jgi:hypothetical protein
MSSHSGPHPYTGNICDGGRALPGFVRYESGTGTSTLGSPPADGEPAPYRSMYAPDAPMPALSNMGYEEYGSNKGTHNQPGQSNPAPLAMSIQYAHGDGHRDPYSGLSQISPEIQRTSVVQLNMHSTLTIGPSANRSVYR